MRWIGIGKWGRNGALLEMKQDNDLLFSAERMTSMTDEFCLFLPARFLCRLSEKFCEAATNESVNICFHGHGLTYFLFIYLKPCIWKFFSVTIPIDYTT